MSKSIALLLVLFFLMASCIMVAKPALSSADVAENSWASKAPMQVARSYIGVAVVNGKIYAIGGSTQQGSAPNNLSGGFVGTNEEYDPETDIWTYKRAMPTPRHYFAIAVSQNKIYCVGGYLNNGTVTRVNEVYNPATNTWETKAPMPTARIDLKASVANGRIYLMGGYVPAHYTTQNFSSSFLTLNEVYDPTTDSWTTKAPLPTATSGYASAVVDNKIYIISSNLNQIYDPATDTWMAGATLPTERKGFGVAVVNDKLYVIGGTTETFDMFWNNYITLYATNEQYTPFGYGTVPPEVSVVSPENKTYASGTVSLTFTVTKPALWLGYSLDGQEAVTITGNTTIAGLTSGLHNVTVYAKDEFKNTATSETIHFPITEETEPFPTTLVVASVITIAVVGVALVVYFKKRKH